MTSYAPTDETADMLIVDRTNFTGAVMGGVAYGAHLVVAWLCARELTAKASKSSQKTHASLNMAFLFIMLSSGTVNFATNTAFNQIIFVDNRMFPGGPSVYLAAHYNDPIVITSIAAYMIGTFFADGLLLYRMFIVWNQRLLILVLPFIIWLASTAMWIVSLYALCQPEASLWTADALKYNLSYLSISLALNVILTILIAGRLFSMQRQVKEALGAKHAKTYTSIVAMMTESAFLYSATGLAFIIAYGVNSPAQNVILPILSQMMCISPELIIWRVATGRAWARHTTGTTYGDRAVPHSAERDIAMSRLRFKTTENTDHTEVASAFPSKQSLSGLA